MAHNKRIVEKREFFRLDFSLPIEFKSFKPETQEAKATTQNISQSGILFQMSQNPPTISSILWMNLDVRTLKICQEIEAHALVFNRGVLGKVVRVEEDVRTGASYNVGVCFLTRDQQSSREVQEILNQIK